MRPETLLHRQINPSWIQSGRVTSQAFRPTPKDENRLSVYDGNQMTPEQAWNHFTSQLGLRSVGVRSITVGECRSLELCVEPDPNPFPAHTLISFEGLGKNAIKDIATRLSAFADARGWLFEAAGDA